MSDAPSNGSTGSYPFCGASVEDSLSPRRQLILEDEGDVDRRAERRLCADRWERVREELTGPAFVSKRTR